MMFGYDTVPDSLRIKLIMPSEIDGYSVTEIENLNIEVDAPFGGFRVEHLVLPEGLETIKERALSNFTVLTSISIPNSVRTIEQYAFYWQGLKTVYYEGTQEQWDAIVIDSTNSVLTNATLVPNYTGE